MYYDSGKMWGKPKFPTEHHRRKEIRAKKLLARRIARYYAIILAESEIRHTLSAELQSANNQSNKWHISADRLFNRLPDSHLKFISKDRQVPPRVCFVAEYVP